MATTVNVPVLIADVGVHFERGATAFAAEYEADYIGAKIAEAVDTANAEWGSLIQSRLDAGILTPALYKARIASAVLRIVRNPDGYRKETEGNYGYDRDARVAGGYLMFTEDDVSTLTGWKPKKSRIGTIHLTTQPGWR